jgi:hypothetical protein
VKDKQQIENIYKYIKGEVRNTKREEINQDKFIELINRTSELEDWEYWKIRPPPKRKKDVGHPTLPDNRQVSVSRQRLVTFMSMVTQQYVA